MEVWLAPSTPHLAVLGGADPRVHHDDRVLAHRAVLLPELAAVLALYRTIAAVYSDGDM